MAAEAFLELTLRVGVTGHRHGIDSDAVRGSVERVLEVLPGKVAPSGGTKVNLVVISPLADGADRIVAVAGLQAGADLWVPVPAKWDDYLQTIGDELHHDARDEAEWLCQKARWTGRVSYQKGQGSYVDVGRFVVDHCDVLIAVVDKAHVDQRGGAAETLAYARHTKVPVVEIDAHGHTTWEFRRVPKATEVERFNTGRDADGYPERVASEVRRLAPLPGFASAYADWFVPPMVRADDLAIAYRKAFYRTGYMVALCALVAVFVGTAQSLFHWPGESVFAEAGLLLAGFVLVVRAGRHGLPERWLCHRALAERLRAAFFLAAAGVIEEPEHGPQRDDDGEPWVIEAADRLWAARPRTDTAASEYVAERRDLLLNEWVLHQRAYQESARQRATRRWHATRLLAIFAVVVTAALALVHGLAAAFEWAIDRESVSRWFTAGAILVPAAAATAAAVGELHEWRHNSQRFERVVAVLDDVGGRLAELTPGDSLPDLARLADAVIRNENTDWFGLMLGRELEPMA